LRVEVLPAILEANDRATPQAVGAPPHATPVAPVRDTLVERTFRQGFAKLRFPPRLERLFVDRAAADRLFFISISSVAAAVLFASLLLTDHFMVPDVLGLAAVLRALVFPPFLLVCVALLYRLPNPALREWLAGAAGCVASVICTAIILASQSRWSFAYVVVLNVVVVYVNTIARFWPAVMMCMVMLAEHALVLTLKPDNIGRVAMPCTVLLLSTVVFTLYYNYRLEHDERHAFLLNLRQKALHAQLKATNLRLAHTARHDALTEVANRRHFDEYLAQVWAYANQQGLSVALMLVDVDHFKAYNDRYGHQAGDTCLQAVSRALQASFRRPGDLVARWGGEEFAVVMTDASLDVARAAADRARVAVMQRGLVHDASGCAPVVTVSVGVAALAPKSQLDGSGGTGELVQRADEALYAAKGRGRNRVWPA
jgi:diguanylate cyclase (GGDEF)-like protein